MRAVPNKRPFRFVEFGGLLLLAILLFPDSLSARPVRPDAGLLLKETLEEELQPQAPSLDFTLESPPFTETVGGGPQVSVERIRITGNTVYREEVLLALVEDAIGKPHDFAGLRKIANRITVFYRGNGFAFARAYIPEQAMNDHELHIMVIEGRYGRVETRGIQAISNSAQRFLSELKPGDIIESSLLERALLVLADQPGIRLEPVIKPGLASGTADLAVEVSKGPRVEGLLSFDNHGNRYSGEYRGDLRLWVNRVLQPFDELFVRVLYGDEAEWLGQLNYRFPIGHYGLRGEIGYAENQYELGAPFEGFTGTAKTSTVGFTYPWIRSRKSNVEIASYYQRKDMDDRLLDETYADKSSWSSLFQLRFDHRDVLMGGGVTYGEVSVATGELDSEYPAGTQGSFTKANLELARLQKLPGYFSFFARFLAQWADGELDSSEGFSLGGAGRVRAYPEGEAEGSEGWLSQVEIRYSKDGVFAPYLFYDTGRISSDAESKSRSISGTGLGFRHDSGNWVFDVAAAWRLSGGDARSDENQDSPRIWFSSRYRF